jgi:predicted pyridoxine 5'-phosphate oxidase superfamily flavin-nucleotide-binding protein
MSRTLATGNSWLPPSPYHPGEQALQERAGVRERVERMGRHMIRDAMPDQHRDLFEKLAFLIVGSLDADDHPWVSIVTGRPGFVSSPDERTLEIGAAPLPGDPLRDNLALGAPVGLLGIELQTRRRNRMNGRIASLSEGFFTLHVDQSFGNCPQYIQAREPEFTSDVAQTKRAAQRHEGSLLSARAVEMVRAADTFFIATAAPHARAGDPTRGVDASHRGGRPGFVRVTQEHDRTILTAPDFRGNFAFNTFGNLALNPRAGLLFIDFATGDLLMLTGEGEVLWDGPELAAFKGAQRMLRFAVSEGVLLEGALALRWSDAQPAPQLAATGSWSDAAA